MDCINSKKDDVENPKADPLRLDTPTLSMEVAPNNKQGRGVSMGLIVWNVIVTILAVIAFIMAAWATNKSRSLSNDRSSSVALTGSSEPLSGLVVTSKAQAAAYPGYTIAANLFRGTGYWANKPSMPYFRSDHKVVTYNNQAILVGGLSNSTNGTEVTPILLNKMVSYDPAFNTITNLLPDMPVTRYRFGAAVVQDALYVFGGALEYNGVPDSSMDIYDFTTKAWKAGKPMPASFSDMATAVANGKIYIFGGYEGERFTLSNKIHEYDPATSQWATLPTTMATPRGDLQAVATNTGDNGADIFILGGVISKDAPGVNCEAEFFKCYDFSAAVEVFNPTKPVGQQISSRSNMRDKRGDFGAVSLRPGFILVAGGETNDVVGVTQEKDKVYRLLAQPWTEEYNVADDYWTPKAPLPEGAFRFEMAAVNKRAFAFGGSPTCTVSNQVNETQCIALGLNRVLVMDDVQYPTAYLLTRNA